MQAMAAGLAGGGRQTQRRDPSQGDRVHSVDAPEQGKTQARTKSGGNGTSSMIIGGRDRLGGRPRGRLSLQTRPFSKSSPPQTPHGSWRSFAASKHSLITGHAEQMALARAIS